MFFLFLPYYVLDGYQGVAKRGRRSLLTKSALVIRVQMLGGGGGCGVPSQPMSTAVHITWHGAQINFGDLTPYLAYGGYLCNIKLSFTKVFSSQGEPPSPKQRVGWGEGEKEMGSGDGRRERMQLHTSAEHFGNVIFRYSELTSQYHFDASI